jgi:hypothetical protein
MSQARKPAARSILGSPQELIYHERSWSAGSISVLNIGNLFPAGCLREHAASLSLTSRRRLPTISIVMTSTSRRYRSTSMQNTAANQPFSTASILFRPIRIA